MYVDGNVLNILYILNIKYFIKILHGNNNEFGNAKHCQYVTPYYIAGKLFCLHIVIITDYHFNCFRK